jgi:hypothetical protein
MTQKSTVDDLFLRYTDECNSAIRTGPGTQKPGVNIPPTNLLDLLFYE